MTASFRFSKTRQTGIFLAFLLNFCPLKMLTLTRFAHNVEWDFFCDFQTSRGKIWLDGSNVTFPWTEVHEVESVRNAKWHEWEQKRRIMFICYEMCSHMNEELHSGQKSSFIKTWKNGALNGNRTQNSWKLQKLM